MKPDSAKLAEFECRGVCVTTAGCGPDPSEAKRANQAAAPAKTLGKSGKCFFMFMFFSVSPVCSLLRLCVNQHYRSIGIHTYCVKECDRLLLRGLQGLTFALVFLLHERG